VEFLDISGELHEQAKTIFSAAGKLEAVIPHPVLAETFYVASKLYTMLGLENGEKRASKLVEWLHSLPMVAIPNTELALEAGRAKRKYGLALTDCYVLASSKIYEGKALFRKLERETVKVITELKKEYQLVFLEEYR